MSERERVRTKQIGHATLYEGTNGKWTGASFANSDAFERHARYEITTEEYTATVRQRIRDEMKAHALMGSEATP